MGGVTEGGGNDAPSSPMNQIVGEEGGLPPFNTEGMGVTDSMAIKAMEGLLPFSLFDH